MSCYRCGTRQVDPDRGESPWRRGVRGDRQVLICPGCQSSGDWLADLDRCPVCAGVRLVRRLGEAECRDCGAVRSAVAVDAPAATPPGMTPPGMTRPGTSLPGHLAAVAAPGGEEPARPGDPAPDSSRPVTDLAREVPDLAREVAAALDRVLGRA